jgi:2-dehydro-3-deoxyphosphooctonate aldolase (KDO 8-P synthase)
MPSPQPRPGLGEGLFVEHISRTCRISGPSGEVVIGPGHPLAVIAGPCVVESRAMTLRIAESACEAARSAGLPLVFKASFDKANRGALNAARGAGIDAGLEVLAEVRESRGVPVTTDIHLPEQAAIVAPVVDIIQIPAFLCRQTDLLVAAGRAAARHGRAVNIKKGQFLSPEEMAGPVNKVIAQGCANLLVTERGTFFGYHRLVNDFIGIGDLMGGVYEGGVRPAVCFDCTHSAQLPGGLPLPGGQGAASGGRREHVPLLARAAAAAGVDAIFMECHPDPKASPSDADTVLDVREVPGLLRTLARLAQVSRGG